MGTAVGTVERMKVAGHVYYVEVIALVETKGGTMAFFPGGFGGGGVWKVSLHGKTLVIPMRNPALNVLDFFYLTVRQTGKEIPKDYTLRPDAEEFLDALFAVAEG